MKKKIIITGIIIILLAVSIFVIGKITLDRSASNYKQAAEFESEAKFEEAIKAYKEVSYWDSKNYEKAQQAIESCELKKVSKEYIEQGKEKIAEYDFSGAVELYQKVSSDDGRYYPGAQEQISNLKSKIQVATRLKEAMEIVEGRFRLKPGEVSTAYYSEGEGYLAKDEVALTYKDAEGCYIVTKKKQKNNLYMTVYQTSAEGKRVYIGVLGEVEKDTGWHSGTTNSLREYTANELINNLNLFDTEAESDILKYAIMQCKLD